MSTIEIPKRLFFIWFGNEIPDFVNFAIDSHSTVNRGFDIQFVHRTVAELEDIVCAGNAAREFDHDIQKSWDILHDEKSEYFPYVSHQSEIYGDNIRAIQILSDILRVVLINDHGGIYLDCDTFPMKSMEDLLCRTSFVVQRHYRNGNIWFDNYFMGSNGTDRIIDPINDQDRRDGLLQTDPGWYKNPNYIMNKVNFFKCNGFGIKNGEKYYIEHYYKSDWKHVHSSANMLKTQLDFCN